MEIENNITVRKIILPLQTESSSSNSGTSLSNSDGNVSNLRPFVEMLCL